MFKPAKGTANLFMQTDILEAKTYLNTFILKLEMSARKDDQEINGSEKQALDNIKKSTRQYIETLNEYL